MGFIFNSGKKQAKIQAAATIKSAEMTAQSDRFTAQAAQRGQETLLAQAQASARAAELLKQPQGSVDVQLGPDTQGTDVDPTTGRRRNPRARFGFKSAGSGIQLR